MSITPVRRFLLLPVVVFSFLHLGRSALAQSGFQVSPDGTRVVFKSTANFVTELYTVKTTGGPTLKLNGPFFVDGDVLDFRISPDSRRVVYLADQTFPDRFELFSVSIDGGVPVKVTGPFINQGDVLLAGNRGAFQISLDGSKVVYIADQLTNERFELFAAPIQGGGSSVRLNGPLIGSCDVEDFLLNPDRKTVVFGAEDLAQNDEDVFSASLEGGRPVRLSDSPLYANNGYVLSADGKWVVYSQTVVTPDEETTELLAVPADGSSPPIVLTAGEERLGNATVTPDDSRVVYVAFHFATDTLEIFSVPIDASSPPSQISPSLNIPFGMFGPFEAGTYRISPDGERVVYAAETTQDGIYRLFSASIDGSGLPVELNGLLVPGGSIQRTFLGAGADSFRILPDGRVLYLADQDTLGVVELYNAPLLGGSEPIRVAPGVAVDGFRVAPGNEVVCRTEEGGLISVPVDGSQSAVEFASGPVVVFSIGVLGPRVVYIATGVGFFSVPIDGSQPPTPLVD